MLVVRGRHFNTGAVYDFGLDCGSIQIIRPPMGSQYDLGGEDHWVAPGMIDLQVNGYGGYDFCTSEVRNGDVEAVAKLLAAGGVTGFCPTVGTNSFATLESSLQSIDLACETSQLVRERVTGIHLEGPYISALDGPRGAHPAQYVRDPDWEEFSRLQKAAGGRLRLVTMAPELPGALDFIRQATRAGMVVALGHHAATQEQIAAAVAAGAVLSTHLGNGTHSHLPRHDNYVWHQLADDDLTASIIVDGHHLPPAVVKAFYRVKGPDRLILVSDAVSIAGLPAGRYTSLGLDVEAVGDGSVRLLGTAFLAGSTLKLSDAINNVMSFAGAPLADAIRMATVNPARLLGLSGDRGILRVGARADLIVLRQEPGAYELVTTVAAGKICYEAATHS
jgi:N-acetylglucosamine-6-phosphate deacetylase